MKAQIKRREKFFVESSLSESGNRREKKARKTRTTTRSGDQAVVMGLTKENATIGVIGMGDMGAMYAQRLSMAGWR